MVIGQKTIQKINNSVNYNNSSSLVIHINENWVVFCLFNKTSLIDLNKERSIDVIVTRLRKKIEEDPRSPKYLQTIRGEGYVLWIK